MYLMSRYHGEWVENPRSELSQNCDYWWNKEYAQEELERANHRQTAILKRFFLLAGLLLAISAVVVSLIAKVSVVFMTLFGVVFLALMAACFFAKELGHFAWRSFKVLGFCAVGIAILIIGALLGVVIIQLLGGKPIMDVPAVLEKIPFIEKAIDAVKNLVHKPTV